VSGSSGVEGVFGVTLDIVAGQSLFQNVHLFICLSIY